MLPHSSFIINDPLRFVTTSEPAERLQRRGGPGQGAGDPRHVGDGKSRVSRIPLHEAERAFLRLLLRVRLRPGYRTGSLHLGRGGGILLPARSLRQVPGASKTAGSDPRGFPGRILCGILPGERAEIRMLRDPRSACRPSAGLRRLRLPGLGNGRERASGTLGLRLTSGFRPVSEKSAEIPPKNLPDNWQNRPFCGTMWMNSIRAHRRGFSCPIFSSP